MATGIYLPHEVVYNHLFPYLSNAELSAWMTTCKHYYTIENALMTRLLKQRYTNRCFRPIRRDEPVRTLIRMTKCLKRGECFDCLRKTTSIHRFHLVNLCFTCRDRYPTICLSNARYKYDLKAEDLIGLDSVKAPNPHGRQHPDMTLFLEEDIRDWCERHRTLREERQAARQKKADRKEELRDKRRQSLIKALQKKGLELRRDSQLCSMYIDGTKKFEGNDGYERSLTLKYIVQEMCEMKYLYEYTSYAQLLEEEVGRIHNRYGFYPPGVHRMAQMRVRPRIPIPTEFPWLA